MNKHKIDDYLHKAKTKEMARQWNSRLRSNEIRDRRMTFGKYAGWFIRDVPDQYLEWGILNIEDRALAEWFKDEYLKRHPKLVKTNIETTAEHVQNHVF